MLLKMFLNINAFGFTGNSLIHWYSVAYFFPYSTRNITTVSNDTIVVNLMCDSEHGWKKRGWPFLNT